MAPLDPALLVSEDEGAKGSRGVYIFEGRIGGKSSSSALVSEAEEVRSEERRVGKECPV